MISGLEKFARRFVSFFGHVKGKERSHGSEVSKKLVAVLDRDDIYESEKTLPIAKLEEAEKACRLIDDVAPFPGPRFYICESLNNENTRVSFFVVREEAYQRIQSSAWFVFPMPMLLKLSLDKQYKGQTVKLTVEGEQQPYTVFRSDNAFYSYKAGQAGGMLLHLDDTAADIAVTSISPEQLENLCLRGLALLKPYHFRQVFNFNRLRDVLGDIPWKVTAGALATVATLYLGLSSLWLHWQSTNVEKQLADQRDALSEVFEIQRELEAEKSAIQALADISGNENVASHVWPAMFSLIGQEVDLLSLRYEDGEFVLRAKSQRATDIIEKLTSMPSIEDTAMDSPVVKSRGKEIISIRFKLSQESQMQESDAYAPSE